MVNRHTIVRAGTYTAAAGCIATGLSLVKEAIPYLTNPQFWEKYNSGLYIIHELKATNPGFELIDVAVPLIGFGGIALATRGGRFHEDWNSLKNFVGQIPNKVSSEVINPIKEKVLRRNTNYMVAMGYSGI